MGQTCNTIRKVLINRDEIPYTHKYMYIKIIIITTTTRNNFQDGEEKRSRARSRVS